MSLTRMHPWELPGKGMDHFKNAIKTDDHCGGIMSVLDAIDSGQFQLWFWEDSVGESTLITEVSVQLDGSKELFIRMISGSGLMESYSAISDEMCDHARKIGCSRIMAYMKRDILEKVFSEGGKLKPSVDFKEMYCVIGKEI